jgi:hypothetical protein
MDSILETIQNRVDQATKDRLSVPLSEAELKRVAETIARGKAPRLDGHAIEFYTKL